MKIITVEPERLRNGLWGYPEGDIYQAYSADTYGEKKEILKAFQYQNSFYSVMSVQTGLTTGVAKAYPIIHASYLDTVMQELEASDGHSPYTGKAVRYHKNDCIFGVGVEFQQRAYHDEEVIDLMRRMYAYGGLFATEAGSYKNLMQNWLEKNDAPQIQRILTQEFNDDTLPQSQAEMQTLVEQQTIPTPQLDLF